MARRFTQEFKDRAVRLAFEHQEVHACSRWSAAQAVASKLGMSLHSVLDWMKKDAASAKAGAGSAVDYAAENARLRAENLELRQVNELLKAASAFFCVRTRPPRLEMIAFIDKYRDCFGVEFICTTLAHQRMGGFMSARGYRAAKKRLPSKRSLRDCELIPVMIDIHRENYGVYGVRKMWHAMKRAGYNIGRDQVARRMKMADVRGVIRGRKPITTKPAKTPDLRPDLVKRNFRAPGPNRLWVADITYVRTRAGFVYTAFVTDVYSRKIVGWATKSRLTTEALLLESLNHAIATAKGSLEKLVHHSDHGSQYVSIAYHERLRDVGIDESTGSVGDSYDNALAETVNGLYKSELIYSQTWEGLAEVEWETLCWVHWWNTTRLHSELGYHTPQEIENHYWATHPTTLIPTT